MSKYNDLWKWISGNGEECVELTFGQIEEIAGIPIDHSFLKYKKELKEYGYHVGKLSMKNKTVTFESSEKMKKNDTLKEVSDMQYCRTILIEPNQI